MKPKIDLNSPLTKYALSLQEQELNKALGIERNVENAVIPIYCVPKTKGHIKKKTKPEQIGTGLLVVIKNEYFIFSATHVFDEFEGKSLLTGPLQHGLIEELIGERLSTGNYENQKIDKYDATVFHIQNEISDELKNIAIGLEYFDLDGYDEDKPVFMMVGFLAKKSNTSGNTIKSKSKVMASVELDDYEKYNHDKISHILLSYENQVLMDKKWELSPRPRGMSGGAIVKAQGTSLFPKIKNSKEKKQLLTAIIIEQHKDKNGKLGILIGTRVNVHLGLIYQFMPDLLKDSIKEAD